MPTYNPFRTETAREEIIVSTDGANMKKVKPPEYPFLSHPIDPEHNSTVLVVEGEEEPQENKGQKQATRGETNTRYEKGSLQHYIEESLKGTSIFEKPMKKIEPLKPKD